MILGISVLRWAVTPAWPLYVRFAIEVTGGAAVYLIVLSVLHGDRLRSFLRLYRHLRASDSATAFG